VRSAVAELCGGRRIGGGLHPRMGACDLRRRNQDENEEKQYGAYVTAIPCCCHILAAAIGRAASVCG
jgi:hypothetical protein